MSDEPTGADRLFWSLADELIAAGAAQEGTMMGTRCLRVDGEFLAMVFHKQDRLIVKLPADRVSELVAAGVGEPFEPAGRVFREWVSVIDEDEVRWRSLLEEGREFVAP